MILGEDKQKVVRIVDSSFEQLKSLYMPIITSDPHVNYSGLMHSEGVQVCLSPEAVQYRISQLPKR